MDNLQSTPRIVDAKELQGILGISEASLIRYKKKGIIPYLKIGGTIRYNLDKVIRSLEVTKNK